MNWNMTFNQLMTILGFACLGAGIAGIFAAMTRRTVWLAMLTAFLFVMIVARLVLAMGSAHA